jgi:hypothetical protein
MLLAAASGCNPERSAHATGRAESLEDRGSDFQPSLLVAAPLRTALREVYAKAGKPLDVLMLRVSSEALVVQARDRRDGSSVIQYEYRRGRLNGPVSVQLRGSGSLDENLFPIEAVNLDSIPSLAKLAIRRVDPQDGKVKEVLVRRALPFERAVRFRVYVESPRRDGYIDADEAGNPIESR